MPWICILIEYFNRVRRDKEEKNVKQHNNLGRKLLMGSLNNGFGKLERFTPWRKAERKRKSFWAAMKLHIFG